MQESREKRRASRHCPLQPPFHEAEVFGDIVLQQSDEEGNPVDLLLADYEAFSKRKITRLGSQSDSSSATVVAGFVNTVWNRR
jgi:hypothetical protein